MAFINTIPAKQASGAVHDMYKHQENHWGYVPNYSKAFSHRPEVMARWGRLLAEVRRPADDRRFELVTFVVARELKHSSCSLAHGTELAKIIGNDNVIAIAEGKEPEVLTAAEIAMMKFARDIARDARKITSGQVEALKVKHGFSDEEVFDIAAIASARCFFTKILDALGSEPDVSFMSIDKELREKIGKGRAISHAKPEYTTA
jgi:alkylhydroperoxidase family enzyme